MADQLVQFRSLTDIVSVKRTLGGAFSVFGRRRVFRGVPAAEGTGAAGGDGPGRSTVSSPGAAAVESAVGPTATATATEGDGTAAPGSATFNASGADSDPEVPSGSVGGVDGDDASGAEDVCASPRATAEHATTRPAKEGPGSKGREDPCRGGEDAPADDVRFVFLGSEEEGRRVGLKFGLDHGL